MKTTSFVPLFSASGSFNCRFVSIKLWVASAMDESIRTRYKDRKSDEHVKVLEQEAFVDRSSEFQPKFLFQEVESTLNHMVRNPCLYHRFCVFR
jgi:hypothetical protein